MTKLDICETCQNSPTFCKCAATCLSFGYMNVYAYITPIVLFLLITEIVVSLIGKKGLYTFQDTVANIGTGIGNQCVNLAVVFLVMKFYGWLWQFAPWQIPETWYYGIVLLVISDFVFYWFHRTGHSLNIFWAAHMPHHSSEEFNLSVGVRASFTQRIFQFMFFDWILVLMGFSPNMVYAVAGIHLLIAYWHHTHLINKLGWVEKVFVTPAHHRVHHGVNPQYSPNSSSFGTGFLARLRRRKKRFVMDSRIRHALGIRFTSTFNSGSNSLRTASLRPIGGTKSGYGSCPWVGARGDWKRPGRKNALATTDRNRSSTKAGNSRELSPICWCKSPWDWPF